MKSSVEIFQKTWMYALFINYVIVMVGFYFQSNRILLYGTIALDAACVIVFLMTAFGTKNGRLLTVFVCGTLAFIAMSFWACQLFSRESTWFAYFAISFAFIGTIFSGGFLIGLVGHLYEEGNKNHGEC